MVPGSLVGFPISFQELPKTSQDNPKTSQRRTMTVSEAPKARPGHTHDVPRLPTTPQDFPKTGSKPLQISIFDGLGNQKLQFFNNCSNYPTLQAAKHLSGDGGMRGAFRRPPKVCRAC